MHPREVGQRGTGDLGVQGLGRGVFTIIAVMFASRTAVAHGKHVLCEKPLTLSLQHAQELVDKARDKKLFFMEGFWTRFFPAVKLLREELSKGSVGKVNIVRAAFCSPTAVLERMRKRELGGGALMGSGCYLIQFADLIFKERPQKIVALGQLSDEAVDTSAAIILTYSEGRMAVLCYNNGSVLGNNTLTIHGSKANIELHSPFHCPTTITLPSGETKVFPLPETPYTYNWANSNGFVYEAECVRKCLQQGQLTECPDMPHEDSLNIMAILDEVRRQLGVVYDNLKD
ncbi:hypothetical protein C0Q70_05360 [Pomacea canaliculata]|uniref:Trans-1,2-dihydrobenzene-1,2-diol dehydrogenase n=1 Tax=Pomacea canaliculata TaxID=400727 RepID=A0A2T7PL34_POMCA|nr:hypothetical protein C0Q70_05360 [Pomacea canaliculata]